MSREQVAATLASDRWSEERMKAALGAAEEVLRREISDAAAVDHFHEGLLGVGRAAVEDGTPQRVEDAIVAAHPDTPLREEAFRFAWLALRDELGRRGDKPAHSGSLSAETWAFTARSAEGRGAPEQLEGVAALFAAGPRVVLVRGARTGGFLAAVRRSLLHRHGAEALVPPVFPGARDDVVDLLRPYVERADLGEELNAVLPRLGHGEDLVGLLGRAGENQPVALLVDDAHIQARSLLLGLPLYLEPSASRDALLVLGAPAELPAQGPLSDLLEDARDREILTVVELTAPDPSRAEDARLPEHPGALRALAVAALEGARFHGLALGRVLGHDEDWVEDLLHDEDHEVDGAAVGGCEALVPTERRVWADLPDGLHPVFRFAPHVSPDALVATLDDSDRRSLAGRLRDALLAAYGPTAAWQVADVLWRLDGMTGRERRVENLLLGPTNAARLDAAFRRLLPVLQAAQPYRLALARLYAAAMELGTYAAATGNVRAADQGFQAAAAAAQRLGRAGPAGEAMVRLGEMRVALAVPEAADQALDLAAKLLGEAGHEASLRRLQLLRAETIVVSGDVRRAVEVLRTAVDSLRAGGDRGHVALGLVRLGRLLHELGESAAAVLALDDALREADASGDPRPAGAARLGRAFVHAEAGELDPAFALLQQAADLFQRARMPVHVVEVAAAGLQRRHGNAAEARGRFEKMAEAFKKAGAAVQWADAQQGVGRCLIDEERPTDAIEALKDVFDIRRRARDRFSLVRLFEDLGQAYADQGDPVRALYEYARARHIAERLGLTRRLGRLDATLARLESSLDGASEVDASATRARATADIEEMEALWKANAQPPAEQSEVVH